ncbi:unnamed protein product [Heligmosomoides polygyrus]|uniref:Uncharacterized protein n=1 Tax=Heligmosomoides polygyrus TaxID=6339 RepID=A0A183FP89_HELPZ|nr:unnamed protein product [Heligmosomoides polygyrus]
MIQKIFFEPRLARGVRVAELPDEPEVSSHSAVTTLPTNPSLSREAFKSTTNSPTNGLTPVGSHSQALRVTERTIGGSDR